EQMLQKEKEKKKILEEQNIVLEQQVLERTLELSQKNKDITDSINYAQRIQKALLASNDMLNTHFKEHFVFFQPKDIVSGDFYWADVLANGQPALVTADSTGHGVPGAIMSMLNISCLNDAVEAQKLTEPGEILNYTRNKIIKHLANDGSAEGGKDGMDCSLVSFDFKNNKLTYAAANNPVWIVRNGELLEFKPDKMPVGKHDKQSIAFTQHTIEFQKNDVIYTLTDGMPDQFGGPAGKKFMYKQLKELLVSVSDMSMPDQKEHLRKTLTTWQGNMEQIDDVCIIGIRL
ncbi:MAG TPA: SpoIIE family protein phosphatase, partial [Bacteroidia bacterium]